MNNNLHLFPCIMDLSFNKTEEKTPIKDFTKLSDTVLITLDNLEAKKFFPYHAFKGFKEKKKATNYLKN